jgi:acetate kinase
MQVLVINNGSSSIKFRLVEVVEEPTGGLTIRPALLQGSMKGIGSVASFEVMGQTVGRSTTTLEIRDHAHALRVLLDGLAGSLGQIEAVGHRVVHGGDRYVAPMPSSSEAGSGRTRRKFGSEFAGTWSGAG